jgi:hypothetical protein
VNVLVALAWPNHVHHARAASWFKSVRHDGWATAPVTESGFVRVSSNARVVPDARPPQEAIALLGEMTRLPGHTFWSDDVSIAGGGAGPFERVVGYRQITDAHLLTLAIRRGGRLATFDRSVAALVPGNEQAVELIP